MAYSTIPQSYIDGVPIPRDFGQKTKDNFDNLSSRIVTLEAQMVTANAALNKVTEVRYEHNTGTAAQTAAATSNTTVQFPQVIRSNGNVVASGSGNNAFLLGAGYWTVSVSLRCSTNVSGVGELSIAVNGSGAWGTADVVGCAGSGSGCFGLTVPVFITTGGAAYVSVNLWNGSASSTTIQGIGSALPHATSIDIMRQGSF
jgi:hypothetical protein